MSKTGKEPWEIAMDDMKDYFEEIYKKNNALLHDLTIDFGSRVQDDFKAVLGGVTISNVITIVDSPDGESQHEFEGLFTSIWVDQTSTGIEGDSYEGFIYAKFDTNKWLKIPYEC